EDLAMDGPSGVQVDYGYGGRLTLGQDGPLTFEIAAGRDEREFESGDPDAVNTLTTRFSTTVTAQLDPATEGRVTYSFVEEEEEDAANEITSTNTAGLGVTRDLGNASSVSADVTWFQVAVTETAIVRSTTVTDGIGGRLGFEREVPNGSFSANIGRVVTQNGPIDTLLLGREINFPTSSLSLEGGIVITDGDTVSPLLNVGYERNMRDGAFSLSVSQDAGINGDDQTVVNTRGNASLRRDINAVSSLTASLGLRNQSAIGGGDSTNRIDGSLIYRRDLARDLNLRTGYSHARILETGEDERVSNTVFVTLSKSFSGRP
ncbi:MAG: hypothetical protein AAGO57_03605, partial [Pseudomonadota bacterium]